MIILDTNVVSEALKPVPDPAVVAWLADRPATSFYLTAMTEAEMRLGVLLLPSGRRRTELATALDSILNTSFQGRVLPFDRQAAAHFAAIAADRRALGRPVAQVDGQIAAAARSRGAAVATRNVKDFVDCGVELHNPWQEA